MSFDLPAWASMWGLAVLIYCGFKALTWLMSGKGRGVGYLLFWPGMDPRPFDADAPRANCPARGEWLQGGGNFVLGAVLVWGVPRLVAQPHPVAAGWAGMAGLAFLLHFGLFRLLGLAWRAHGVDVQPLMDAPHRSASLSEFWGRRWNSAFRDLAFGLLFTRLVRRLGAAPATMAVFLASGLIHDLVISVPARGGYGLPTGYFLLQGLGLLAERSALGRRAGLGGGATGWAFTALVAGAPAFWLFHPPFVMRVFLPFLDVIGAV